MLYYETINNNSEDWVVFIHGLGGSILTWKKQIDDFSKNHNVLLLDLMGHGKSHKKNDNYEYNLIDMPNDIKEVLSFLHIEKAHFVGMSLGTLILAFYAILYPETILSLIMGGGVIKLERGGIILMNIAQKIKKIIPKKMIYPMFARILMPKKTHSYSRKIFIRESLKMKSEEFIGWISSLKILNYSDVYIKMLSKIKDIPILYIMGSEDYMFLNGTKKALEIVKNAELKIINNCGHVCTIEKSKEFNLLALAFINNNTIKVKSQ